MLIRSHIVQGCSALQKQSWASATDKGGLQACNIYDLPLHRRSPPTPHLKLNTPEEKVKYLKKKTDLKEFSRKLKTAKADILLY